MGIFQVYCDLQRNLKRGGNQDDYIIFKKGFEDTEQSVSLMCILSKKDESGKNKIISQLEMDRIASNIQNTEKTF